jgi:hypothetical protein
MEQFYTTEIVIMPNHAHQVQLLLMIQRHHAAQQIIVILAIY